MKEELHHLLDGEVSDVESAGLLRALAEDGQDLSLFRQQMKLRQELSRNGCHGAMTAGEESEMLDRVRGAIGIEAPPRGAGTFMRRVLPFVAGSLLLGGGIGYMAHSSSAPHAAPPEVRQSAETQTAPAPAATASAAPIDRDSLVRAVRDSMAQAVAKPAAKKRVTHSGRRSGGSFDDPTGAAAARELAKKKKVQQ